MAHSSNDLTASQSQTSQASRDLKSLQLELRQLKIENDKLISAKKSEGQSVRQLEQSNKQY
jgi:hypothetical protein